MNAAVMVSFSQIKEGQMADTVDYLIGTEV